MQAVVIEGATHNLGAPPDWDDRDGRCAGLPAKLATTANGTPFFSSAWLPSPDELRKLSAGAAVILQVVGPGHPPVAVEVGEIPARPTEFIPLPDMQDAPLSTAT